MMCPIFFLPNMTHIGCLVLVTEFDVKLYPNAKRLLVSRPETECYPFIPLIYSVTV